MADINENLTKAKDFVQDSIKKVQDNESVSQVVGKLNDNEYIEKAKSMADGAVKTAKKNKNYKYIVIGTILLVIILLFQYCANTGKKEAKNFLEAKFTEIYEPYADEIEISAKCVYNTKHFYIFDLSVKAESPLDGDIGRMEVVSVTKERNRMEIFKRQPYTSKDKRDWYINDYKLDSKDFE